MHLKSVTMKGFKSFPDRIRLDFGPGVSVVVGPNGSGKSNVTDAVLWAMGEQSPLAVRGQSMQDVIFGGGRGVKARSAAEVEIVLDNADGTVDLPLSDISIVRRLERSGEGEYRLNGARCRLVDVLEVLSDTGLGKETHSVISQGRVEAIVTSKPRDRRMLIEEAAGLGKHRKRRRRAQLKLEHTQENLDRALDIEREARGRLRPLKRQAEAAELHERLERQMLEVRWELAREALRAAREQLESAEAQVAQARQTSAQTEERLREIVQRRGRAEQALAARVQEREALARRAYGARSAAERLELRTEQVCAGEERLQRGIASAQSELDTLAQLLASDQGSGEQTAGEDRIGSLEGQLAEIEHERERELARELETLEQERQRAEAALAGLRDAGERMRADHERADSLAEQARAGLREAEVAVEAARREAARVGAELAAVNQFLRSHASSRAVGHRAQPEDGGPRALNDALEVSPGYELALAAALGGRLDASLAGDLPSAQVLLDGSGPDGAVALLADLRAPAEIPSAPVPPAAEATRLLELVKAPEAVSELTRRLLWNAWVVRRLEDLPGDFDGIAVTRSGRVWFAGSGEVRQLSEGGSERVLARRNERERLVGESEAAAGSEQQALAQSEHAREQLRAGEAARELTELTLREHERRVTEAGEELRRAKWLIEQRTAAPEEGPLAVRRAQLQGELAAERRQTERLARERSERLARVQRLRARQAFDGDLLPLAERLLAALAVATEAVAVQVAELDSQLASDREAGEEMGAELRRCATLEADIQAQLRAAGERVTTAEVSAQRLRDQAAEAELERSAVAERLELDLQDESCGSEPLAAEQAEQYKLRLERLARRREQLGPVNPLAQEEYAEALAHVEELERRRADLETALRELRTLIRDTDRQIQEVFKETFDAAARNFSELVADVFPGGSGQLRLVSERLAPRPVLGGQESPGGEGEPSDEDGQDAELAAEMESELGELAPEDLEGVEIEITPAGKSSKRLSLLSGGEKSMTALAFLFAVFLARPCPFYILDEVEAALDDLNLGRFLALLRRYAGRAQFIVITHQQRTMEAADWLYGVSMGGDGVSKVLSRRLPSAIEEPGAEAQEGAAEATQTGAEAEAA